MSNQDKTPGQKKLEFQCRLKSIEDSLVTIDQKIDLIVKHQNILGDRIEKLEKIVSQDNQDLDRLYEAQNKIVDLINQMTGCSSDSQLSANKESDQLADRSILCLDPDKDREVDDYDSILDQVILEASRLL